MKRKTAERELKVLMNNINVFTHKFRDRGYIQCPTCHMSILTCPRCRQDMLMPKAQSYPDYLGCADPIFIEVKFGRDRYAWEDISKIQRETLTNNDNSWIFIVIGGGRVPNGRGAWLVPWDRYLEAEVHCLAYGHKSIVFEKSDRSRVPTADEFWQPFRLEWSAGSWSIPLGHAWWKRNNTIGIPEADMEQLHEQSHTT